MTQWYDWSFIKNMYGIELSPSCDILYCEQYSDYSWSGILVIYQDGENLYYNDDYDNWNPIPTTMEESIQLMLDFEEGACSI